MKLKVTDTLSKPQRISSIDIFRSLAIIMVVVFHYGSFLTIGYIGVDMFFVISGLLVGGLLTKEFLKDGKVNYPRFVLQRGFKIWPSYYFFLIIGNAIAFLLYHKKNPEQIIPFWDVKKYLFFFQNYTGLPFRFSFDHVWSLCVEEHFYILLPLFFVFASFFLKPAQWEKSLYLFAGLTILMGIIMKLLSFYLTNSKDTYSATHNRIDALAWGVLLNLIITYRGNQIREQKHKYLYFFLGLILFSIMIILKEQWDNVIFNKIVFHSTLPFCFFLMILGVYNTDFSKFKSLRIVAYYSYNWYLWHPVFAIFIMQQVGETVLGLTTYLLTTFLVAIVATVFVEEKLLARREIIISRVLKH